MKLFKRIYYPVLCVLLVAAIALGFVDATYGGGGSKTFSEMSQTISTHIDTIASSSHNSHNADNMEQVRTYISNELARMGFLQADGESDDDGNFNVDYRVIGGVKQPSFTIQDSTLTPETVQNIEHLEAGSIVVSKNVRNIVVAIPGTDTLAGNIADAVMLMAHYDSRPEGAGASDNTVSVASMLGVIEKYSAGGNTAKNDLVFVFTDAEEENMYGAYAFKYQFAGFDDIYSRVELGANFDNLGNAGTLVMFQTSDNNINLVKEYAKINKGAFTSSIANFVYGIMSNFTDFDIYADKTSLDFANVGGTDVYHTYLDNAQNVKLGSVEQQYSMMERYVNHFAGMDLPSLKSGSNAVYFSYLDIGLIWYPLAVAFVMGAIIIGLIAAIIIVNVNKRKKDSKSGFSMMKMGGGIAVQLLTMVATLAVLFLSYFLICLLLVGFGVIPFHAIGNLRYASVGLVVSVMLLTLGISFAFYNLFKKIFMVKSADVVRGNVALWGIIGAILCFAAPTLSYFFAITAILELAAVLVVTLLKEKYRQKTGERMDALFIYLVPLVFVLPIIIPVIMIAATVLSAIYLPVIMMLFLLLAGFAAPYFTQLQPVLDSAAQKLPPRNIRIERTVVKKVEDVAKKGKFTEQTVKEVVKEPVAWRYKNYVGVSFIAVISVIMILLFSSFGAGYSSAVAGGVSFRNAVYNDSMVYVWTKNSSVVTRTIEVHDLLAYKYMSGGLDGFSWNSEKKAYVKADTANTIITGSQEPTITKSTDGRVFSFTLYDQARSEVSLKINDAASITKLTFRNGSGDEYSVDNDANATLYIDLPYGYGNFTLTVEGATSLNLEYTENRMGKDSNIKNLREWVEVSTYFADKHPELLDNLTAGIVLKYNLTL